MPSHCTQNKHSYVRCGSSLNEIYSLCYAQPYITCRAQLLSECVLIPHKPKYRSRRQITLQSSASAISLRTKSAKASAHFADLCRPCLSGYSLLSLAIAQAHSVKQAIPELSSDRAVMLIRFVHPTTPHEADRMRSGMAVRFTRHFIMED